MKIDANDIHIFAENLESFPLQENEGLALLSPDEHERANRFHFPKHRQRYINARSLLRTLISLYVGTVPQDIIFSYTDKKKPYLPHSPLQFNLSHSEQMVVYAFTLHHEIGVDIEKIQETYNEHVAQRFFSEDENKLLLESPKDQRTALFYKIWARKEAIVKATGTGLSIPLSSFSVSIRDDFETVMIDNKQSWSLAPLNIHPAYQSAVATNQIVKNIIYWKYIDKSAELVKVGLVRIAK